jgi:hypothetical protein
VFREPVPRNYADCASQSRIRLYYVPTNELTSDAEARCSTEGFGAHTRRYQLKQAVAGKVADTSACNDEELVQRHRLQLLQEFIQITS